MSIDAQRRKLQSLASDRELTIVKEFFDAVESGKDDNRPGFQQLLRELKDKNRSWTGIMLLDTSRLARNIYLAEVFKHECKKRGVRIIYANLPEANPMVDMLMVQILQAFDQMHSMMSKEKGLAGMAENVKQGYRAGGRAPWGYQLQTIGTGAVRDGSAVTKTKLVPSNDASLVASYLSGRAAGRSRISLMQELCIKKPDTSLIDVEWNALCYAGNTVWNVHNEYTTGGYKNGTKRRPRAEWIIQKNTHEALITDDEAETILKKLSEYTGNKTRTKGADYILSGLLVTPDGTPWHGNAGYYRAGKKNIKAETIESQVLTQIASDMLCPEVISRLTEKGRAALNNDDSASQLPVLVLRKKEIESQMDKLTALLTETSAPGAILRSIEKLEAERMVCIENIDRLETRKAQAKALGNLKESHVAELLQEMANNLEAMPREFLKDYLKQMLVSIELDAEPALTACRINYRLAMSTGDMLASPGGFEPPYSP